MLILSRKINESIIIGDQIEVSVLDIRGDQVKIGIRAPDQVKVFRLEIYKAIQEQNIEAARARPDRIPRLDGIKVEPAGKGKTKGESTGRP